MHKGGRDRFYVRPHPSPGDALHRPRAGRAAVPDHLQPPGASDQPGRGQAAARRRLSRRLCTVGGRGPARARSGESARGTRRGRAGRDHGDRPHPRRGGLERHRHRIRAHTGTVRSPSPCSRWSTRRRRPPERPRPEGCSLRRGTRRRPRRGPLERRRRYLRLRPRNRHGRRGPPRRGINRERSRRGSARRLRPRNPTSRRYRGRRMSQRLGVLDGLAAAALQRAEELRKSTDLDTLYQEALLFEKRDFDGALKAPDLSVIAEIKRASPSAGFIGEVDPAGWGARYEREGAACLSVLTEPEHFKGSLEDLDAARGRVALPVLRKDFSVDEAQVLEAGTRADAVLLIAALFEMGPLARYVSLAVELGLTPLVEVHDEREADLALESGAQVIGVNNRDLRAFTVG